MIVRVGLIQLRAAAAAICKVVTTERVVAPSCDGFLIGGYPDYGAAVMIVQGLDQSRIEQSAQPMKADYVNLRFIEQIRLIDFRLKVEVECVIRGWMRSLISEKAFFEAVVFISQGTERNWRLNLTHIGICGCLAEDNHVRLLPGIPQSAVKPVCGFCGSSVSVFI